MKYQVGDHIICKTEILPDGKRKRISILPTSNKVIEEPFEIIGIDSTLETYKMLIADNMIGWDVSKFHIQFQHVDKVFLGKKFYDITESLIIGLQTKAKKKK